MVFYVSDGVDKSCGFKLYVYDANIIDEVNVMLFSFYLLSVKLTSLVVDIFVGSLMHVRLWLMPWMESERIESIELCIGT